jgi:hypothetical protein
MLNVAFIYCYAECHYADCRILFTVMLSVIMPNVAMLCRVAAMNTVDLPGVTGTKLFLYRCWSNKVLLMFVQRLPF